MHELLEEDEGCGRGGHEHAAVLRVAVQRRPERCGTGLGEQPLAEAVALDVGVREDGEAALLRGEGLRVRAEQAHELLVAVVEVGPAPEEQVAGGEGAQLVLGAVVDVAVPRLLRRPQEVLAPHTQPVEEHLQVHVGLARELAEEGGEHAALGDGAEVAHRRVVEGRRVAQCPEASQDALRVPAARLVLGKLVHRLEQAGLPRRALVLVETRAPRPAP